MSAYNCLTSQSLHNTVPVVKAFSTRHTIGQISGGASITPVTLQPSYTF